MKRRWLVAGFALALMPAAGADAQATAADGARVLDAVEVTGSRLKRTDVETASPLQVIGREEIARSGAVSLVEVLQRLPASNIDTVNPSDTINTRGAGAVSLHGLGAGSTLVLINGRRVAPFAFTAYGTATFVDLNQIPIAAIDRIEVLLDGASAIYGADALAGVVNVILRREYRGTELKASVGRSTHGDAGAREAVVTLGAGDLAADGYNGFASFSHSDQDALKATARWHSATADYRGFGAADMRSPYSSPGNLYATDNTTFLQPLTPCALIGEAGSPTAGRCLYDPAAYRDLAPESRRDALFAAGRAALPGGFEAFGDAAFSRSAFRLQSFSVPTSIYAGTGTLDAPFIRLPVGHPQNPTDAEVALRTRFADQPRFAEPTSETARVVAGVRHGDLGGWDVESALLWSSSRTRMVTRGVIDERVLLTEVLDANGRALPTFRFGDPAANDPALMARLYPALEDHGRTSTASLDARAARALFALPGGNAQVAIGGELRHEHLDSSLDPRIAAHDVTTVSAFVGSGSRTVGSAFAEFSLPIARGLEASLAGRFDHYSDFGGTFNPKAGIKWQAKPGLALRATYAAGYRAPSLIETNQSPRFFVAIVQDPLLCPVFDAANPNCARTTHAVFEGNPNLKPERAHSTTAGIVVEPVPEVSFTADAFSTRRHGQITSIDVDYLLAHESDYPGYVVRGADGRIEQLNLQNTNLGSGRVWGVDATAHARKALAGLGTLGVEGSVEWLPHYWQAATNDGPLLDYAGSYAQPKARGRLVLSLDRAGWKSSLAVNYTGSYSRAFSPADAPCPYQATGRPELCRIASWRTLDLFVGYTAIPHLELGLVVNNLDNVQAPFDERSLTGNFTTYQTQFHSAVGRFFKLTLRYEFR